MVWISYVWLNNFIWFKIFPALASKAYADRIQFPCSVLLLESYKIESPLKWTFFPALIGSVLFAPVSALHKSLRPVLYLSALCTVYKYLSALCTTCATVHIVFANPLTSLEVAPGPFLVGSYLLVCYWQCALLLSSILSLVLQVVTTCYSRYALRTSQTRTLFGMYKMHPHHITCLSIQWKCTLTELFFWRIPLCILITSAETRSLCGVCTLTHAVTMPYTLLHYVG